MPGRSREECASYPESMWSWRKGVWRRRAERRVAVQLVTNAILEIRCYAAQDDPEHLAEIHELADVVHNLPGGIIGGGERRPEPYGYHTFRYVGDRVTASTRMADGPVRRERLRLLLSK